MKKVIWHTSMTLLAEVLILTELTIGWSLAADLPAFPGAVGQGALSTGGRGGDVYHVTELSDYGSGSRPIRGTLRHGIESASGPRTIVFDVGGGIELIRPLRIDKSNLTLAGQTSPGGITIFGYPTLITHGRDNTFDELFGPRGRAVHDVIARYIRFRTGDFNAQLAEPDGTPIPGQGKGNQDLLGNSADALTVWRAQRVILDHVSASWGMDETLSVTVSRDVTIQNSIIAESLKSSFHHKGPHGYGSLVRGELTEQDQQNGDGGYTFYGNLYAHHDARNPAVGGQQSLEPGQDSETRRAADVNFVNNIIYNWGSAPTHRAGGGEVRMNYFGNYVIAGPDTPSSKSRRAVVGTSADDMFLFQSGNFVDSDSDNVHDGVSIDRASLATRAFVDFPAPRQQFVNLDGTGQPFNFFQTVDGGVVTAEEAYLRVVDSAGASLNRDVIDQRYIDELTSRTGSLIDSQDELRTAQGILPGIHDLSVTSRPPGFDVDKDGMSDRFEIIFGLDAGNPRDRNAASLSAVGYTNLEVYLDALTGIRAGDLDLDGDVDPNDANTFLQFFDSEPGATLLSDPDLMDMEAQLLGDVIADRRYTVEDRNAYAALYDAVNGQGAFELAQPTPLGDCNGDGVVDRADIDCACAGGQDLSSILEALGSLPGDVDFDGQVQFSDFLVLANNFGTDGSYGHGDFDCNGIVEFGDFLVLANNFGQSGVGTAAAVPEPSSLALMLLGLTVVGKHISTRRRTETSTRST